jgi:hypothetical protein
MKTPSPRPDDSGKSPRYTVFETPPITDPVKLEKERENARRIKAIRQSIQALALDPWEPLIVCLQIMDRLEFVELLHNLLSPDELRQLHERLTCKLAGGEPPVASDGSAR